MAFKTFAPGVLTSSDVNTFLMRQAVITCTSSTRPASPSEGMTIYETDTDLYRFYTGSGWETLTNAGQWVSYTPTFRNFTLGNGTASGRYFRVGRVVHVIVQAKLGSTSSMSSNLEVSMPFGIVARENTANISVGSNVFYDQSLGVSYTGFCTVSTSTTFLSLGVQTATTSYTRRDLITASVPMTWTTNDEILLTATYETSSA